MLVKENCLKAVEDQFTGSHPLWSGTWHLALQNPAPGKVLQGDPITQVMQKTAWLSGGFESSPSEMRESFKKPQCFAWVSFKLLLPCIIFLLQLAKYFCIKSNVSSSLPAAPVWLRNLKPDIVGVFAVVSDNFTNTELKYCCKNQAGRGSGEKAVH